MQSPILLLTLLPVLAAQPLEPVLYAATDAGVQRSTTLGRTWTPASEGLDGAQVTQLLAGQRNDPKVIYAAADTGVFKTTDGERWTSVLNEPKATSLAIDAADEQRIYAAASGQLFTSIDGGRAWTRVPVPFPVAVIATDPFSSVRLYATATHNYDRTFATSTDRGASWQTFGWLTTFPFLTLDPTSSGRLYTSRAELIQSRDNGQTWSGMGPQGWDLLGILPEGAHTAQMRRVTTAFADPIRPSDVHTCIEARWVQYENPEDIQGPATTGIVPGWANFVSGLWSTGPIPGDQPCVALVRVVSEDTTLYAAGTKIYRRNGLVGRKVDLVTDLASPVRSLILVP